MCIRAFIFGFTVLGFAGVHCSYILRNETTLEHMADRPYDVRVDFDTSGYNFEIVSVGPENYLFEQSKKDNWRSVMGDSPLSWFGKKLGLFCLRCIHSFLFFFFYEIVPIQRGLGNGLVFPYNDKMYQSITQRANQQRDSMDTSHFENNATNIDIASSTESTTYMKPT